ncbi:hypothetical protein ES703_63081 [subsurface metagenome]
MSWKNPMMYDSNLLITYKVIKGRPISPFSYSSLDSYGHDKEENLVEIPFAQYDMQIVGSSFKIYGSLKAGSIKLTYKGSLFNSSLT